MEKLTADQFATCNPKTSEDSSSVTSSAASWDGASPCASPAGPMIDLFGRALAPAKVSAPPGNKAAQMTRATSGRISIGSSASVALAECLASRLQARLASVGSMEYSGTWKRMRTGAGRSYWAHTASARRTSGSGCTGWPTPQEDNANNAFGHAGTAFSDLGNTAQLAGWPTPAANKLTKNSADPQRMKEGGAQTCLADAAWLAQPDTLTSAARLAGWATCSSRDWKDTSDPTTWDCAEARERNDQLGRQVHGVTSTSSPAATDAPAGSSAESSLSSRGALNPAHSRWLMGFPAAWCQAAIRAHRKFKRRPKPVLAV